MGGGHLTLTGESMAAQLYFIFALYFPSMGPRTVLLYFFFLRLFFAVMGYD